VSAAEAPPGAMQGVRTGQPGGASRGLRMVYRLPLLAEIYPGSPAWPYPEECELCGATLWTRPGDRFSITDLLVCVRCWNGGTV